MQLKLPHKQLKALGLQQYLTRRGEGVIAMIHRRAVDGDGDRLALASAFDSRPLAERAFDVVLAAGIEQLLEVGVVARPPQLPAGELLARAAFLPAWPLVGAEHHVARDADGNGRVLLVLAANGDEIADAALGE